MEKYSGLKKTWDAGIVLCATLSALLLPVVLVFDHGGGFFAFMEWMLTILYGADFVFLFRGRRREGGRIHPAAGFLLFDFLAAIPFFLLPSPQLLLLCRLFKLFRVLRHMQEWKRHHARSANVLRLAFFIYWLFLTTHWISCGWVVLRDAGQAVDGWTRYLRALYWCVTTLTTVGYGDITPSTNGQMLYDIGVMILGVGMYAYIIGNIATILTYTDPARAEYVKQQERLAAFMEYRGLPHSLQRRIRDYYEYLWEKRLVYNESTIIKDLPPGLSMEVSLFLKRELIENVPLFKGAGDAFIREVALELQAVVCPPGEYVIRSGDVGRDMYFISRGTVEVVTRGQGQEVVRTMTGGDFFGEIALFFDRPRSASVRAVEYCDLFRLDKGMFERVLSRYPEIAAQMELFARQRNGGGATFS